MILVVGATGVLGTAICHRLRTTGQDVRALVRPGSPRGQLLRDAGVQIAAGDLRVRGDVEAACRGVTSVISTATAMGATDKSLQLRAIDGDGQRQLVDVAKASGVQRYIFISASPNLRESAPLIRYKRAVERAIRASGMQWTILQPSCFMEIWLGPALGWDFDRRRASIFGSGVAPVSWVSVADVAEHAVHSLDDPRLANRDLPLGGAPMPPNEVLAEVERAAGAPFKARRIPRALLASLSPITGWFDEGIASGMSLGAQAARGDVIDSPLQREIGIPLTTVADYARRVVGR
ncbi:MAG: NmrA family NAD(P)-binding protein [Gemmatimonadaceae bacterium]|nr:NmrA family NAD(P)-binding protein [Gemmatimonadaceae bacterium]